MRRAAAERTLEQLCALLGAQATVLVRGPAGIGKSTLVERALRRTPYVLGQSLEPLRDLPYHPLTHAFARSFAGAPSDVASEVAAELGGRTLVVEDVQWSDETTLETIGFLAGRVGLVVTSRNGVALGHHADVAVVDVPPLERAAALSLARRLHPDLDSSSRRQLVDLAGGIPLLIEQLAAGDEVSPTLIDAVRARVERLPTVTIEQLAVLAVHGRPLPTEWLDAVGAADVVHADALVVTRDECVALTHALVADAVVDLVDDDVRRQIRHLLATVCADADGGRHLLDAGDLVGAATRAEAAAPTAAPAEKAQLLALAVDARGDDAAPRLRLDAAAALLVANQPMRAEAIVEPSTLWRLAPIAEAARAALGALERERRRSLLSRREVEVLELVADGRTTSQIATTLGVGNSTVVTHVNSARAKLGARTRRQAAAMVFVEAP